MAPSFQTGPAALGSVLILAEDLKGVLKTVHPFQKEGQPFGLSFFLGFAAHRAAALFRLKCSGTAKPPLRNSSRRGPEGPCRGLGCDLVLSADLKGVLETVCPFQNAQIRTLFVVRNVFAVNEEIAPRS